MTSHSSLGRTPAELFMERRLRTRLELLRPQLSNRIQKSGSKAAKTVPPCTFAVGDCVMVRDHRNQTETWKTGVMAKLGPLTYHVEVDDLVWKRHINQLRPCEFPSNSSVGVLREMDSNTIPVPCVVPPVQPSYSTVPSEPEMSNFGHQQAN